MQMLAYLMSSHKSLDLSSHVFSFFFIFFSGQWIFHWFFPLLLQVHRWTLLVYFSIQLFYIELCGFYLVLYYISHHLVAVLTEFCGVEMKTCRNATEKTSSLVSKKLGEQEWHKLFFVCLFVSPHQLFNIHHLLFWWIKFWLFYWEITLPQSVKEVYWDWLGFTPPQGPDIRGSLYGTETTFSVLLSGQSEWLK